MSILPDLIDLFPDIVSWEQYTGEDTFGVKTYAAAAPLTAFVYGRNTKVMSTHGQEVVSSVQAVIASTTLLSPRDRFTLPARFTPVEAVTPYYPPVLAVDNSTDEGGHHHATVYF